MSIPLPTLGELTADYVNTAEINDAVFNRLTAATWANPMLSEHRRYAEAHKLGFGDPAFHAMWLLIMQEAARRFPKVRAIEIGIFKGQVISLWSLIAKHHHLPIHVEGIGPLQGSTALTQSRFWRSLLYRFNRQFRSEVHVGNLYEKEDYPAIIDRFYRQFELDFGSVQIRRGFSTDPKVLDEVKESQFEVVYVDGDHTYEGARHDFRTFGPKVAPCGWLVADDASFDLPGKAFWKGYESVTRATTVLTEIGFRNVLNVGHNRIFEKTA